VPTLGTRAAGPLKPNGVVSRSLENQSPALPVGHNPVGVDCLAKEATQGCPCGPTLRVSEKAQGFFWKFFLDKRSTSPRGTRFFNFQSGGSRA